MLEQKLATLQRLLAITQEASDTSWQVLLLPVYSGNILKFHIPYVLNELKLKILTR